MVAQLTLETETGAVRKPARNFCARLSGAKFSNFYKHRDFKMLIENLIVAHLLDVDASPDEFEKIAADLDPVLRDQV